MTTNKMAADVKAEPVLIESPLLKVNLHTYRAKGPVKNIRGKFPV